MNEPKATRGSHPKAVLERRADGVLIKIPPAGFFRVSENWFSFTILFGVLGCSFWWLGYVVAGNTSTSPEIGVAGLLWIVSGFSLLSCIALLILLCDQARKCASIEVFEDRLTIVIFRLFWRQRYAWMRQEIEAIQVWSGLRIVTDESQPGFFKDRRQAELRWIAGILRQALNVGEEWSVDPGCLRVAFTVGEDMKPLRGFLEAGPGELMVFNAVERWPCFNLRRVDSSRILRRWLFPGPGIPISAEEVTCRIRDDGSAYLMILLPWKSILQVWHCNKDVLESVLARFLGAKEDPVPEEPLPVAEVVSEPSSKT